MNYHSDTSFNNGEKYSNKANSDHVNAYFN